jgi:hypothetical protein
MSIDVTADRGALVLTGSATELAALARELAAVVDPRAAEIAVPTTATPERVLQLLRTQRLRLARLRGRDGKVVAQIYDNRFSTWYLVSDRYLDFKDCTGTKFFSDTVDENYDFGNDYFRTWTRHDSNLRGDPYGWLWSHNDGSKGGEQSFLLHYNQRLLRSAPYSNCQGDAC